MGSAMQVLSKWMKEMRDRDQNSRLKHMIWEPAAAHIAICLAEAACPVLSAGVGNSVTLAALAVQAKVLVPGITGTAPQRTGCIAETSCAHVLRQLLQQAGGAVEAPGGLGGPGRS